jgi:putative Ca2+/H+ antiporter (TMEM165/GDT1 family)
VDHAVLISTFSLLFVAEMGDKTQLMAMTLAHRYSALPVLIGTFLAFLVLNLAAVLVGEGLSMYVPREAVLGAAAALFLIFAYHSWRDTDDDGNNIAAAKTSLVWLTSFSLIFVAELGDKTQLAMVAMAAQSGELLSVFIGGTLALWMVSLLGVVLGRTLLRRISKRRVQRAAALLFLVFGILVLGQLGLELRNRFLA